MCQFNYTIIKNKKSVSYLTNHGYDCFHIFPGGYKAFGGNRPGFCDCGSMVGSHSLTFRKEGKYPFQLSANDYWRAVKNQSDSWEASRKRMKSPGFAEEVREFDEALEKINAQLRNFREAGFESENEFGSEKKNEHPSASWQQDCEPENADREEKYPLDEAKENDLIKQREALFASKDAVFFEARSALFSQTYSPFPSAVPEVNPYKSPNYNMKEFRYYRRMFGRLLEFEPYVCFTHIFDEPGNLTLVKTLRLGELKIGDLAMLAKDDVIRICR